VLAVAKHLHCLVLREQYSFKKGWLEAAERKAHRRLQIAIPNGMADKQQKERRA